MATKTLEARFEHLSVKDDRDRENGGDRIYGKQKVLKATWFNQSRNTMLTQFLEGLSFRSCLVVWPWLITEQLKQSPAA